MSGVPVLYRNTPSTVPPLPPLPPVPNVPAPPLPPVAPVIRPIRSNERFPVHGVLSVSSIDPTVQTEREGNIVFLISERNPTFTHMVAFQFRQGYLTRILIKYQTVSEEDGAVWTLVYKVRNLDPILNRFLEAMRDETVARDFRFIFRADPQTGAKRKTKKIRGVKKHTRKIRRA